jgi:hypothetical protein
MAGRDRRGRLYDESEKRLACGLEEGSADRIRLIEKEEFGEDHD